MSESVMVYESNWGLEIIPDEIVKKAEEANNGKSVLDKRTRGYKKFIRPYEQDANEKLRAAYQSAVVSIGEDGVNAYFGKADNAPAA